jgi:molybdenum cofactor cytidylyltransferase
MPAPSEPLRVAGIVLAAGASRRMGADKLLLTLDGETLVRRTCRHALEAGLDPVVVVVGEPDGAVCAALSGLNCRLAINPHGDGPMGASLRAGLAQLPPGADAAVVMLADMPRVSPRMLRALAAAAAGSDAPLVISTYGEVTAPPTLFRRGLFAELLASTDEHPGRAVARRHRAAARVLCWPAGRLLDLDTPADYAAQARRE